jgi:signal transduction histidine kinase
MRWLYLRNRRVLALLGYDYPAGYVSLAHSAFAIVGMSAAGQRIASGVPVGQWWLLIAALLLTIAPIGVGLLLPRPPVMVVFTAEQVLALLLFWQVPVSADAAPLLLVLTTIVISAVSSRRRTAVITLGCLAVAAGGLIAGRIQQGWLLIPMICFAAVIGQMLQIQLRLLSSERQRREQRAFLERAAIAAEVHDVVAHSLSVVLLNVTAARRTLTDDDPDHPEAVEALIDAERVGRAAMIDIRSTIELLRSDGAHAPQPGLDDIDELISTFDHAGSPLDYRRSPAGPLTRAAELAAYRVVQESVSNAVRHAPGTRVRVRIGAESEASLVVRVSNPLPDGARRGPGGSGLAGMISRVENLGGELTVSAADGDWTVTARLPYTGTAKPGASGTAKPGASGTVDLGEVR